MPLFDFRSIYMPYCLKKIGDSEYVILNREYKPVGFNTNDFVHYEDYPVSVKIRISKITAKALSVHLDDNVDEIHLYNDGCVPTHNATNMKAYLAKLKRLAKLETSGDKKLKS